MNQGKFLAKALYDNVAETPDELAFRRGDVLTVLEQDPGGLEGWWLCSLRGKNGIAPGNRLKIVSGMGDAFGGSDFNLSMDGSNKTVVLGGMYDQPSISREDYDVPRSSSRSSLPPGAAASSAKRPSIGSLKVPGGGSSGHLVYDTPPSSNRASGETDNGIYDTPPSSKRTSCERTPPTSNRSSAARDSAGSGHFLVHGSATNLGPHQHQHQQQQQQQQNQNQNQNTLGVFTLDDVRRRSGSRGSSDNNCYETPPGSNRSSNRSSLERILSEEGPPIYETLSPATSLERIAHIPDEDATYDTLPVRNHALSNANPASQTSLHSTASNESLLSATSGVSGSRFSSHGTTSLPDSARSSMDIPSETYDVPVPSQNLDRSRKQLSMDSGLGFYDSPTKSRPGSSTSSSAAAVPSPSQSSEASSSSSNVVSTSATTTRSSLDSSSKQTATAATTHKDFKRSKSLENALDDDIYDVPRNNAAKPRSRVTSRETSFDSSSSALDDNNVYDVPPQVTRDSVISNRSDSSDENRRLSTSSFELDLAKMGLPLWDELLLDYDSALEVLVKRQQDLSKATSRVAGFVTPTWRTRASLEKTLYDIKVSCTKVQNCLSDFVEFAMGTVANASKLPDNQLASRLYKYVSPLQNTLDLVKKSFASLEEMKWQVSLLSEPLNTSKPDDLGQIALVSKELMGDVKRAASFIQSNGQHLFKKASTLKAVSSKPPIVPKGGGDWTGGKVGNGYGYAKVKSVQQRPLPAVPIPDKRVPSSAMTPVPAPKVEVGGMENNKKAMYAIKESSFCKDDYAECDELFESNGRESSASSSSAARGEIGDDQGGQEYDYVQLDDNTLTRSNSNLRQETQVETPTTTAAVVVDGVEESSGDTITKKEKADEGNQNGESSSLNVDKVGEKQQQQAGEEIDVNISELSLEEKEQNADAKAVEEEEKKIQESKDNDDVDMVPVKESSTLERPKDKTNNAASSATEKSESPVEEKGSVETTELTADTTSTTTTTTTTADEIDEQKTPVNTNSIDVSNFPLPEVTTPKATDPPVDQTTFETEQLDPNDHQVLVHYSEQMNSHSTLLANAIDAFIGAVGANQAPNVFISHSKFVIVSAHKLVHIGDTVHRNLTSNAISARVMHSANHLCDCLKASVNATKMAALQFPSPVAIQEMTDKVIAVSHAAHQLKFIITQAHRQ